MCKSSDFVGRKETFILIIRRNKIFYAMYQSIENGKACVLGEAETAIEADEILEEHKALLKSEIYTIVDVSKKTN